MTSQPQHSIAIVPIGSFDLELIEIIISRIEHIFGVSGEIIPLLNDLSFALDPKRKQYHSTPILEKLAAKTPPDAVKILALCHVDLFIPILTHVYGEAQIGGKACIISTHRLKSLVMWQISPFRYEKVSPEWTFYLRTEVFDCF